MPFGLLCRCLARDSYTARRAEVAPSPHPTAISGKCDGAALFVVFLLPLIGIALETAILIALLSSGIVGRVLLRRPWTVEAVNVTHPQRSAAFAVKGWRRSSRAIDELTTAIPVLGLPEQISEGTPVPR